MAACRQSFGFAAILAAWVIGAAPAEAERIIPSISRHRVQVTSSFVGTQIVLFAAIDREAGAPPRNYDIVVTVFGPKQTVVTRRKARVLGIWANVASRTFINVPTFISVLTNKPIDAIVKPEVARRLQIGLENIVLPQQIGPDIADTVRDDPFRANFVKLQVQQDLYSELNNGVTFVSPIVFRADIPLPAMAPIGSYEVDVKLLADGNMITRVNTAFELVKFGFEQRVADAARNHGVFYGLATVLMAFVTGWLASVVFRRD